jgi:peptidoglycan/xylan/chitin deacetylase (PgdA/CDA1 family)
MKNMRIPGLKGLKHFSRWFKSSFVCGALILLYHRVAEEKDSSSDPFRLCVTPEHFASQMDIVRQTFTPVSLFDMTKALQNGDLPRQAVAVTFDDGYADNLYNAKPILESYDIPVTFFIVSGSIGRSFWWDQLAQSIFVPRRLPRNFSLSINGKSHKWQLRDSGTRSRRKLIASLYGIMKPLPDEKRRQVLERLSNWAGITLDGQQDRRALTAEEMVQLASGNYIEIGAHTVTHRPLGMLPVDEQRQEIIKSKENLELTLNKPITSFSYPFGQRSDYTAETSTIVREAGFECACTNIVDVAKVGSDLFQLPRYWVRDWSGPEFSRRIEKWLRS